VFTKIHNVFLVGRALKSESRVKPYNDKKWRVFQKKGPERASPGSGPAAAESLYADRVDN